MHLPWLQTNRTFFFFLDPPSWVQIEGAQYVHQQSQLHYSCYSGPANPASLLSFTVQGVNVAPYWRHAQPSPLTSFISSSSSSHRSFHLSTGSSSTLIGLQSRYNYTYNLPSTESDQLVLTCTATHPLLGTSIQRTLIVKVLRKFSVVFLFFS